MTLLVNNTKKKKKKKFVLAVTLSQWLAIAEPCYKTLFHREKYLKEFSEKLSSDAKAAVSVEHSSSNEKSLMTIS